MGLSRGMITIWEGAKMLAIWGGAELEMVYGSGNNTKGCWGGGRQGRTKEEGELSSAKVEVSSSHDVHEKSKGDGSKTASERLDSDLVLGKIKSKFWPPCSDISSMNAAPSEGKEEVWYRENGTNLLSLFAVLIRLSGSKTLWSGSASGLLLVLIFLAVSLPSGVFFMSGVTRAWYNQWCLWPAAQPGRRAATMSSSRGRWRYQATTMCVKNQKGKGQKLPQRGWTQT